MGVIGKVIGGTIGFAMGGPLGAIAGAAFGHMFDSSKKLDSRQRPSLSYSEASQLTFFVAAFSMLAKLAHADGRVSTAELDSIGHFMRHELNLDPQSQNVALNTFNAALESPQSFQDFAQQFYQHFHDQPQLLEMMMDILFRVAAADGTVSSGEEQMIHSAATLFMFSEDHYRTLKARYVADTGKDYAVLGCHATDSDAEIKRRYRQLVKDYHPDKIASKGLPEEFTKFANNKFSEIQAAYDAIRTERGIS